MKIMKRMLSLFVCLSMLFLTASATIVAVAKVYSEVFSGGDGTVENPYIIRTANQLSLIGSYLGSSFILGANIDMSTVSLWTPVGTEASPFTGSFNGNGYVISNLTVDVYYDKSNIPANSAHVGFFGYTNGSAIVNLGIENAKYTVTSGDFDSETFASTGGIAGAIKNTTIDNCYFEGTIRNDVGINIFSRAAGIAAIGISSTITNCYSNSSIYANAYNMNTMAAGLVAWLDSVTINKCYASGSVVGENTKSYCYVGGASASGNTSSIYCYIISYGGTVKNSAFMFETLSANGTTNYVNDVGNFCDQSNNRVIEYNSAEAFDQATFEAIGWDFDSVWTQNDQYPSLSIFDKNNDSLTEDSLVDTLMNNYINQHIDFVNSLEYNNLITYASFYDNTMKGEDDSAAVAYGVWEYLGDVGEIASLKFDDLMVFDNPYDLILSDLFTQYSTIENFASAINLGIFECANKTYDSLLDALKSRSEWDETYTKTLELEIKGIVFEPDYKVKDSHAYEVIEELLNGLIADNRLESIFVGLKRIDTIYQYISDATDVVNNFIDAYNAYVAAMGSLEAKGEILTDLIVAGYEMDPICGAFFIDSLSEYLEIENEDDAFEYALNELLNEATWTAYDVVGKKLVEQGIHKYISKALGGHASTFGILTFTYNTTYNVLDYLCAIGSRGELYKLMYASSMLESALMSNVKGKATTLKNNPTVSKARTFDASWGVLQNIEAYSYQLLAQYVAKSDFSTRFLNFFNKNYVSEDMAAPLFFSSMWKKTNCHLGEDNFTYKIVSVKCPTDVEVFINGISVLAIADNKINKSDANITAMIVGDEKYIALPTNAEYSIKITATDDGQMTYSVSEFDSADLIRYVRYDNVPLVCEGVYEGVVDEETYTEEDNYKLSSNVAETSCAFDSLWGIHDDNGNHVFTKYISNENATCISFGTKTAFCDNNCGMTDTVLDDNGYAAHIGGTATCQNRAICTVCGEPYGEYGACVYDIAWFYNCIEHWHECVFCGDKTDIAIHTYIKGNDVSCDECEKEIMLGDVNLDDYVDNLDAAMILKYDAGIIEITDAEIMVADANGDNIVDNLDATMILKYDAGIINSFI